MSTWRMLPGRPGETGRVGASPQLIRIKVLAEGSFEGEARAPMLALNVSARSRDTDSPYDPVHILLGYEVALSESICSGQIGRRSVIPLAISGDEPYRTHLVHPFFDDKVTLSVIVLRYWRPDTLERSARLVEIDSQLLASWHIGQLICPLPTPLLALWPDHVLLQGHTHWVSNPSPTMSCVHMPTCDLLWKLQPSDKRAWPPLAGHLGQGGVFDEPIQQIPKLSRASERRSHLSHLSCVEWKLLVKAAGSER